MIPESKQTPNISPVLAGALTAGFGATVAMWVVGFLARAPGVNAPGPVAAAAILAAFAGAMILAGRAAARTPNLSRARQALTCALAGLVAAVTCLLVVGALLADPQGETNAVHPSWPVVVLGWLASGVVGGLVFGHLGAMLAGKSPAPTTPDWHARFAIVAAASVFPLIVMGGLVTGHEAGFTVPDWPTTFGANMFLYPLSRMTGGIYYEHAHRLFGALVGLTTLTFLVLTLLADRRRSAKILVAIAFLLVCAQGVVGGQWVKDAALPLVMIHGVLGQVFFAFMCIVAAVCSARWKSDEPPRTATPPGSPRLVSAILLGLLLLQLTFGVMLRHMGPDRGMHAMMSHIANSVLVLVVAVGAGFRCAGALPGDPLFRRLGMGAMHTAITQMLLGGLSLWMVLAHKDAATPPTPEVLITTAHQALGAALLAFAAAMFAWSRRLVLPRAASAAPA